MTQKKPWIHRLHRFPQILKCKRRRSDDFARHGAWAAPALPGPRDLHRAGLGRLLPLVAGAHLGICVICGFSNYDLEKPQAEGSRSQELLTHAALLLFLLRHLRNLRLLLFLESAAKRSSVEPRRRWFHQTRSCCSGPRRHQGCPRHSR